MAQSKKFQNVTTSTRKMLGEGENERVDFKRVPQAVSVEDIVAFANSDGGGTILIGVDESVDRAGSQIGQIVGCEVSDSAILAIANKALSCLPPVAITVRIENLVGKPILRVDVPSSGTRPHCTAKGIYCRRDGAQNRPLHPTELLKLFLDSEGRVFAERFEAAADRVSDELQELEYTLDAAITSLASDLGWAEQKIGDTESTLSTILAYTAGLRAKSNDAGERIKALMKASKVEDPIAAKQKAELFDKFAAELRSDDKLLDTCLSGGKVNCNISNAGEISADEIQSIFSDALSEVAKEKGR